MRWWTDALSLELSMVMVINHLLWNNLRCTRILSHLTIVTQLDLETMQHGGALCAVLVRVSARENELGRRVFTEHHVFLLELAQTVLLRRAARALLVHDTGLAPHVRGIKLGLLQTFLSMAGPGALVVNFLPALLAEGLLALGAEGVTVLLEALLANLDALVVREARRSRRQRYCLLLLRRSCRRVVILGRRGSATPAIFLIFFLHAIWGARGEFICGIRLNLSVQFLRRFCFIFAII